MYHFSDYTNTDRIRQLNDAFRRSMVGGRVLMTQGFTTMGNERIARLVHVVRTYDQFDHANDPHGEHDFGSFDRARIFVHSQSSVYLGKRFRFAAARKISSPDDFSRKSETKVIHVSGLLQINTWSSLFYPRAD